MGRSTTEPMAGRVPLADKPVYLWARQSEQKPPTPKRRALPSWEGLLAAWKPPLVRQHEKAAFRMFRLPPKSIHYLSSGAAFGRDLCVHRPPNLFHC
jgi:hypothetical protein